MSRDNRYSGNGQSRDNEWMVKPLLGCLYYTFLYSIVLGMAGQGCDWYIPVSMALGSNIYAYTGVCADHVQNVYYDDSQEKRQAQA